MKFDGELPHAVVVPVRSKFDNGHWEFPEQMGPGFVGFIYVIYDSYLNRAYIGKKNFLGRGTLNKGEPSNWKKYMSSSAMLKELISV